ncbi:unnamed protein product [Moneuplotes crassus]|uniref:Protein kinase domain-containing protein n=1 Tax=Euplotes crassus TaxID=5936 RepID=A0AAD1U4P6_EUPCR|nr:unnamed protein product [Moneuplotes crassus]
MLVLREAEIIKKIGFHPNIINLVESYPEGMHDYLGVTEEVSYNVLEYCPNGSLYDFVKRNGPLGENEACFYFKQLVYAVKHLHDNNIAHCDIKPGNIFFDEYFNIKLGDFGCAFAFESKQYGVTRCLGTKSYMAPEVFKASKETPYSPFIADILALGCTLYFMVTGKIPLNSETCSSSTEEDSDDICSPSNVYIGNLEELDLMAYDMIERCTSKCTRDRPDIECMSTHPWFDDRRDPDHCTKIFDYMKSRS